MDWGIFTPLPPSLLAATQLAYYQTDLLNTYRQTFGEVNVLPTPIADYHLSDAENLRHIMEFLRDSHERREKVVVHCSVFPGGF